MNGLKFWNVWKVLKVAGGGRDMATGGRRGRFAVVGAVAVAGSLSAWGDGGLPEQECDGIFAEVAPAKVPGFGVRFHDEANDTLEINRLLGVARGISDPNARVEAVAREFLGRKYVGGTLECADGEVLTVNLDEFDCTTLVDNVMAVCVTAGEGRDSWRDFVYNLEKLRYRGGTVNGYASRLHYISDWVVDNVHRGNFEEVTGRCGDATYEVKTLNFMTANRGLYPALSDSATYERVKDVEIGYRSHRFPLIRTRSISGAMKYFLKSGDIIAFTTGTKGLDVSHMAIVVVEDGEVRFIHASSREGKVVVDRMPLGLYLQKNRGLTGIRVFRLKE